MWLDWWKIVQMSSCRRFQYSQIGTCCWKVGAHELFTPSELMGRLRCPAVIVNRKWKGQSKIVGSAARWTAVELDGLLTLISVHMPHKGRQFGEFEATLTEFQEFLNGRPNQHVILG